MTQARAIIVDEARLVNGYGETRCPSYSHMMGAGVRFDAGMAEYLVTNARHVVRIGDIDPVTAAPLTDAGLTTYRTIKPALPSNENSPRQPDEGASP